MLTDELPFTAAYLETQVPLNVIIINWVDDGARNPNFDVAHLWPDVFFASANHWQHPHILDVG